MDDADPASTPSHPMDPSCGGKALCPWCNLNMNAQEHGNLPEAIARVLQNTAEGARRRVELSATAESWVRTGQKALLVACVADFQDKKPDEDYQAILDRMLTNQQILRVMDYSPEALATVDDVYKLATTQSSGGGSRKKGKKQKGSSNWEDPVDAGERLRIGSAGSMGSAAT